MKILSVFGRVEGYKKTNFEIGGSVFSTHFVTEALRKKYAENGAEVFIFAPSSLLDSYGGIEGFEKKVKEMGHEGFRTFEIPSLGEWAKFSDVVVAIFLKLVEERPENVIVSITTGLNIYTVALVDAVRRYVTYRRLERILQGKNFEAGIASHPPPDTSETLKVELYELPVMVFFSFPDTDLDKLYEGNGKRAGEIGKKYADVKKKFREISRKLKIAFNSIRYNTPLAFYENELLKFDLDLEETEREVLAYCNDYLRCKINLDLRNVTNAFYVIAMMKSFREFRDSLKEPNIEEIREKFLNVYKELGLGVNGYFLQSELGRIESLVSGKNFEGRKTILELEQLYNIREDIKDYKGMSRNPKRNFFAHSGFLKEWTEVELRGGKVLLGWKKENLNEIREWILRPEY